MADFSAQIAEARKSGHSDDDILSYLGSRPEMAGKIKQAQDAGYKAADILGHLSGPVQPTAPGVPPAPIPPGLQGPARPTPPGYFDSAGNALVNGPLNPLNWPGMVSDAFESPFSDRNMAEAHRLADIHSGKTEPDPFMSDEIPGMLGELTGQAINTGVLDGLARVPGSRAGAGASGAVKGAWRGAMEKVPVSHGLLPKMLGIPEVNLPAVLARAGQGATAGEFLGGRTGAVAGGVAGGAAPVIRGAVKGMQQGLKQFDLGPVELSPHQLDIIHGTSRKQSALYDLDWEDPQLNAHDAPVATPDRLPSGRMPGNLASGEQLTQRAADEAARQGHEARQQGIKAGIERFTAFPGSDVTPAPAVTPAKTSLTGRKPGPVPQPAPPAPPVLTPHQQAMIDGARATKEAIRDLPDPGAPAAPPDLAAPVLPSGRSVGPAPAVPAAPPPELSAHQQALVDAARTAKTAIRDLPAPGAAAPPPDLPAPVLPSGRVPGKPTEFHGQLPGQFKPAAQPATSPVSPGVQAPTATGTPAIAPVEGAAPLMPDVTDPVVNARHRQIGSAMDAMSNSKDLTIARYLQSKGFLPQAVDLMSDQELNGHIAAATPSGQAKYRAMGKSGKFGRSAEQTRADIRKALSGMNQ